MYSSKRAEEVLGRYQVCASRIWNLFNSDPLPDGDPAHFMIERLESILDHGLLVPRKPKDRLKHCDKCGIHPAINSIVEVSYSQIAMAEEFPDLDWNYVMSQALEMFNKRSGYRGVEVGVIVGHLEGENK